MAPKEGTWEHYSTTLPKWRPILKPANIYVGAQGLVQERMKAPEVKDLLRDYSHDFPDYLMAGSWLYKHENPKKIFDHYINYFKKYDGDQAPPTPLDISVDRPVWLLYNMAQPNWEFSENIQYSTANDTDDMTRNFEKVCTMKHNNALILSNRCRSNPRDLKFNLHVCVTQEAMKTDIIIDPGSSNGGGGHPPNEGGD